MRFETHLGQSLKRHLLLMPVPKKLLIGMVLIFIAIAFSPIRFSICGWLMNEPFYANKPLSY